MVVNNVHNHVDAGKEKGAQYDLVGGVGEQAVLHAHPAASLEPLDAPHLAVDAPAVLRAGFARICTSKHGTGLTKGFASHSTNPELLPPTQRRKGILNSSKGRGMEDSP